MDAATFPAETQQYVDEGWATDFSRSNVSFDEIMSGGPPRDGIPAIDDPQFDTVSDAGEWVTDSEPVIAYENRAYPLQVLTWHEIVNDTIDGTPIAVTFCPLCGTSIVFDRRLNGDTLDFGVSGKLRMSDMVMYDRQTESWWQQFDGSGIVGTHTDEQLKILPAQVMAFSDFAEQFPDGDVLNRDTGNTRDYGRNPYSGYDELGSGTLFGESPSDDRLPPKERVLQVPEGAPEADRVYAFSLLDEQRVINDGDIVVAYFPGATSVLDTSEIQRGRETGAAATFSRMLDGRELTFEPGDDLTFRDVETGSSWNQSGLATDGELAGAQLDAVAHVNVFWFAVAAFVDELSLYESS